MRDLLFGGMVNAVSFLQSLKMVCINHGIQIMKVLRIKPTADKTGLPRSTIYLYMKQGRFPKPVKLGARAVGWVESEIDAWLKSRLDERA